jgi:hypothetical protein
VVLYRRWLSVNRSNQWLRELDLLSAQGSKTVYGRSIRCHGLFLSVLADLLRDRVAPGRDLAPGPRLTGGS